MCDLKRACRGINGLISYGLCFIAMMKCTKLNQMIKTYIKIVFNQKEKYIRSTLRRISIFSPLVISISFFHIMHT